MKKTDIYTREPVYIRKPQYLTCDFSAISAWIFMQPKQVEAQLKDLSNDI